MRHVYLLSAILLGCNASNGQIAMDGGNAPPPDLAQPALGWAQSGLVSPSRDHHGTFVVEANGAAFLYVIGGTDHFTSYLLDDVERAPIAADGSLGNLSQVGKLPHKLASMGVVVVGDRVIIGGGVAPSSTGAFTLAAETYVASVKADGTLGDWIPGPNLPSAREHLSLVARDNNIYLIGGLVGKTGTADVERATLAADGTLSDWIPLLRLPAERSHHASVIADGAVWVVGGLHGDPTTDGASYNDVLRAAIHDDGSLDPWTVAATLPAALSTHSTSFYAGALYVFGGLEDDSTFVDTVRFAALAPDGSLGAWQTATPLPSARGHVLETPIWRNHVYSAGGYDNDGLTLTGVVAGSFQ
ncbi:MAG TPA: hypothetical protein VFF06_01285 [Polyangia bacterium]|nr:hypothetical protein [Polyangia bacterium]